MVSRSSTAWQYFRPHAIYLPPNNTPIKYLVCALYQSPADSACLDLCPFINNSIFFLKTQIYSFRSKQIHKTEKGQAGLAVLAVFV